MADDIPPDDDLEVLDISELIDAHLEAQSADEFASEAPTAVELRRLCPGCTDESIAMEGTDQPPASHADAWGKHGGACRGNSRWYWCRSPIIRADDGTEVRGKATLTMIGSMEVFFFPDRRLVPR